MIMQLQLLPFGVAIQQLHLMDGSGSGLLLPFRVVIPCCHSALPLRVGNSANGMVPTVVSFVGSGWHW